MVTNVRADTVALLDGRKIEGKISFDAKSGLIVLPKNQPSQPIKLEDVLSLSMEGRKIATPKRRATLVNGTQISADEVLAISETEVRLKRPDGSLLDFSPVLLQRVDFRVSDKPEAQAAPPVNFVGVMTATGDFAEGDIIGVDQQNVRLSSVLFGIQEFNLANAVQAIQYRSPGVSRATYEVKAIDGSLWQAASIAVDRGKLVLQTDSIGKIELPGESIATISLGPGSTQPLNAAEPIFTLTPDTTREVNLDGKYRTVLLSVRVPGNFVPNRPVRFVFIADGKEIARTEPITSIDGIRPVVLSVTDRKSLSIKVTAEGSALIGVAGEVSDARLIRRG
jgi:hypothetical protein